MDADAWQVAEALKNNMSLNSLDLSYNHFGELGGIRLAAGLVSTFKRLFLIKPDEFKFAKVCDCACAFWYQQH